MASPPSTIHGTCLKYFTYRLHTQVRYLSTESAFRHAQARGQNIAYIYQDRIPRLLRCSGGYIHLIDYKNRFSKTDVICSFNNTGFSQLARPFIYLSTTYLHLLATWAFCAPTLVTSFLRLNCNSSAGLASFFSHFRYTINFCHNGISRRRAQAALDQHSLCAESSAYTCCWMVRH